MADDYGVNPVFSGKRSRTGRPIWRTPTGKLYSERTMTIPLDFDEDGRVSKGSRWINVPTVFDGGQVISNEDFLLRFYSKNKFKDPITGDALNIFKSLDEAISAANKRSKSLME